VDGNKKVEYLGKTSFYVVPSSNDVITSKNLVDLESIHQGLSYEVLHGMVPSISKFLTMGKAIFDPQEDQ
jgi:hypothetical protein